MSRPKGTTGTSMMIMSKRMKKTPRIPYTKAGPVTVKRIDPETGEEVVVETKEAYTPHTYRKVVLPKDD